MPYNTRSVIRPVPRPRRQRPNVRARTTVPTGTGSSLAAQLGGYAGVPRVYLSFSPPLSANPAWIEVTPWVDVEAGISISPGRTDGLSDVNASTCTLTVDNTDGRWTYTNTFGAWYGQLRKGCWLRVDLLPLSGTVSRRFTGYLNQLPSTWEGQYATVQITSTDILSLLGTAPKYTTMISEDWLTDPYGAPYIVGYFPLNEPQGSSYALDISGQAPAVGQSLQVRNRGVKPGAGIAFSSTSAPGPDQQSCISFSPTGPLWPNFSGGSSGSHTQGSVLQGTVNLNNETVQFSLWVKTTTAYQPVFSWTDPNTNYATGLWIDPNGYAAMWQGSLSGATVYSNLVETGLSSYPIADGQWHMLSLRIQSAAATAGTAYYSLVVDGVQTWDTFGAGSPTTGLCPVPTLTRFTLGGGEGWNETPSSAFGMFTGSISDLVIHQFPNVGINANWYSPYVAGAFGHAGESCGERLVRLVAYAGLPTAQNYFDLPGTTLTVSQPFVGTSPATNLVSTAHLAGPQTLLGQDPITCMRTVAHTENMPMFVDAYGRITLQPSTTRQNPSPAISVAAVDLDPGTGWADDYQYLVNQVTISPSGAGEILVTTPAGQASVTQYGIQGPTVDTVSVNATEAWNLGASIIAANCSPAPRPSPLACEVATLALLPAYGTAWYDQVLAMTVSSVVQVTNWPPGSHYAGGNSSHVVEGWTETIGPGSHLFAWASSAAPPATYQLDSPTLGLLDTPGIVLAY